MPAPSSPSLPPRNPRNPQMRTPLREAFCKRRGNLLNKLSELCRLTGARAAVIVLSITGRLYFSGGSSVEEMKETSFDYVRRNGGAMPPMGPEEWWKWVEKRPQRTEIAKIADQVKLRRAFSNRLPTLIKMASELCTVTDARAAVVVFSDTGFHNLFGNDSFENIIFDWVKKQCESRVTKEDIDSLNLNCVAVLHYVREKLKDISGSGNSGVGAGWDSSNDNFDSRAQSFEAPLFADLKDNVSDGLMTSPVNSAVASGSSGKEPMRSVLVGCEFNPHSSPNLSKNNPSAKAGAGGDSGVGVDDSEGYDDDWIHSLPKIFEDNCPSLLADFENCARNDDHDSFLNLPVNLAAGGGTLGVESIPMCSDLEDCRFDPADFLNLSKDYVHDDFWTLPENLTVDGGSSGEQPTRSGLEGCGYNPDIFVGLDDLDVSLAI